MMNNNEDYNQVPPLPIEDIAEPTTSIVHVEAACTPIQTPRTPSQPQSAENESPTRRILKRGDLVRSNRRNDKLESRLGRVTKCIPVMEGAAPAAETNDGHPFRYDVDWVLGGKTSGLWRMELIYTTADAEGMTDDAGRSRRKRKPNAFLEESTTMTTTTEVPTKKKATDKKKPASKKTTANAKGKTVKVGDKKKVPGDKKATSEKKAVANAKAKKGETTTKATTTKPTAGQKRKASETTTATATTNASGPKQKKSKASVEVAAPPEPAYVSLDMYERHRREFERIVTRLEKLDPFGFFMGDPPPEFDEHYFPTLLTDIVNGDGVVTNGVQKSHDGVVNNNATTILRGETVEHAPNPAAPPTSAPPLVQTKAIELDPSIAMGLAGTTENQRLVGTPSETTPTNSCDAIQLPAADHGLQATPASTDMQECTVQDMEGEIAASTATSFAVKNGEHAQNCVVDDKKLKANDPPKDATKLTKKNKSQAAPPLPLFPSHPPFNWKMVRRRMEHGRYVLDREHHEEEERYKQLAPYYKSIGLRRKRPTIKKAKAVLNRKKKNNMRVLHPKGVDWELFLKDINGMCEAASKRETEAVSRPGTISFTATKIKEAAEQAFERTGRRHIFEMSIADARHMFSTALEASSNQEAAMQGKWRKGAFPERKYERLKQNVVCHGLSELDEMIATYELRTTLQDSFVGLSYAFNDTNQSELWMTSVLNDKSVANRLKSSSEKSPNGADDEQKAALALATDNGVVHAQVKATMQSLLIAVQDRVLTEMNVLHQPELKSANWADSLEPVADVISSTDFEASLSDPELVEQPVWGIDCYTRRNILICLEIDFDADTALTFVEKWLLPAINACPVDLAYNIANAARILEGLPLESETSAEHASNKLPLQPSNDLVKDDWSNSLLGKALLNKIKSCGPAWLTCAARQLRLAFEALGPDFFRVHPKGHGSVVLTKKIEANTLVTFYRGEVYPSWRWGEKMDAIEITQNRKGLKPALPDFYNMALERPQSDPRGYGLLFVDASRKAGHGSSLSHSCEPTCEVRVAAVNGELCLAMTTIRALEIGEELTFDYNAVTESLNEYRSAVCLCGHGKCRGSFLHFATADCYQQVLNRNAPIATRFSNLAKSCMKKVMSEEDERILTSHGFGTASFGAISVDRRRLSCFEHRRGGLDSIDIVPIWLRTYVADTLRYIEYERRALPVALLCNHLSKAKAQLPQKEKPNTNKTSAAKSKPPLGDTPSLPCKNPDTAGDKSWPAGNLESKESAVLSKQTGNAEDKKKLTGARPEPSFIYYARMMREHFKGIVGQQLPVDAAPLTISHTILKAAGAAWKTLSEEEKGQWKERSSQDWLKKGDELTKEPQDRPKAKSKKAKPIEDASVEEAKGFGTSDISFEAADAEGLSAMEQRIQQLTQTLSRVGRVLDRHRQAICASESIDNPSRHSSAYLRELVHPPLSVLRNEHVVAWIWNNDDGVVRTLSRCIESQDAINSSLKEAVRALLEKYDSLAKFGSVDHELRVTAESYPMEPSEARSMLNDALRALRLLLLREVDLISCEWRRHKGKLRREAAQKKKIETIKIEPPCIEPTQGGEGDDEQNDVYPVVASVLRGIVDRIVERAANDLAASENPFTEDYFGNEGPADTSSNSDQEDTRLLEQYNQRFRLQATADLLLMYQRTSTFFVANHYKPLESTPIDVYARELGNAVPKSAIDNSTDRETKTIAREPGECDERNQESVGLENVAPAVADNETLIGLPVTHGSSATKMCNPDDIIANVAVRYDGDYVLSQLLQWYNGGIGQKQGLPDLAGCVVLPSMLGCWEDDTSKSKSARSINYEAQVRPRLKEWFENQHKRGSPFPQDIQRVFKAPPSTKWSPFGSPVLDFLVTGDEGNIHAILQSLNVKNHAKESSASPEEGLLSTVDEGMPAQAIANWVQCENPNCLKWRKLPWHVDVDMLPEKFFCKDNKWNPTLNSCEAPEEAWSDRDAQIRNDGIETATCPIECESPSRPSPPEAPQSSDAHYAIGARLDVLRTGKSRYCVAIVVDYDAVGKRVKFHYLKTKSSCDEWIEIGSPRIAPLHSKVVEVEKAKKVHKLACNSDMLKVKKTKLTKGKAVNDLNKVRKLPVAEAAKQVAAEIPKRQDNTDDKKPSSQKEPLIHSAGVIQAVEVVPSPAALLQASKRTEGELSKTGLEVTCNDGRSDCELAKISSRCDGKESNLDNSRSSSRHDTKQETHETAQTSSDVGDARNNRFDLPTARIGTDRGREGKKTTAPTVPTEKKIALDIADASIPRKRFHAENNPFREAGVVDTYSAPYTLNTMPRIPRKVFHGQDVNGEFHVHRPTLQSTPTPANYLSAVNQHYPGNNDIASRWHGRTEAPQRPLAPERSIHSFGFESGPGSDSLHVARVGDQEIMFRGNIAQRFQPASSLSPSSNRNFPWPNRQDKCNKR